MATKKRDEDEISCDSSWHERKLPLKFHVDAEVTEAQARKLLKACVSILGPAVKEGKK